MSGVVSMTKEGHIASVVMADRDSRNTFSQQLVSGLLNVFGSIAKDDTIKVVVLQGYDTYFCCGGSQDELLRICDGEAVFTDGEVYDLLLRCDVPVIAAMQGHALGGGLALGSYADMIVIGRQCLYSANFMKYGFTPGFGSTYILPKKFGATLGREMLFTAKTYYGDELKERGADVKVVDRPEVVATAMKLAAELATKPRRALTLLKAHMNRDIQRELAAFVSRELEMHQLTISQPEVRERIKQLYHR
jgi:polyketide biosynthesis enoyl-CoA hydratase PksI